MEGRRFFRFSLILFSIALVLLFTWANLPQAPPEQEELLHCAAGATWCSTSSSRPRKQPPRAVITNPRPDKPTARSHASDAPRHPLDPLTANEINRVRAIIQSHEVFADSSAPYALHSISLEEPDKPLVLGWRKGDPLPPRRASVVARVGGRSRVLTVDIASGTVEVVGEGPTSGYPMLTIEDMTSATWAPFSDAKFNSTVVGRGVDLGDVACLPISSGWYGAAEEGRRLVKVQCYSMEGTANFYMRPIEGLTVLVDLDSKRVIDIVDKGSGIPIPKAANTDYRFSQVWTQEQKLFYLNIPRK